MKAWYEKFLATGSVLWQSGSGKKPHVWRKGGACHGSLFERSPTKSIRTSSLELNIPRSTFHKVLHKRLHLYAYKVQIVQAFQPNDRPRQQFAIEMLGRIDQNPNYLWNVMFLDEATFHTCGKVNRHNIRI